LPDGKAEVKADKPEVILNDVVDTLAETLEEATNETLDNTLAMWRPKHSLTGWLTR